MKLKAKIFLKCSLSAAFLVSGCATIDDKDFLMSLERSALKNTHEEFEQQLLPIHQRSEVFRVEVEDLEKRKRQH
ncbi:hypothetical protein [Alteromonas sp. W364]|uniref:hypothetical protein n=1 Tax=Alteromonas sp. W364 TaxID=3075610 RepID=UPI0028835E18|nr:hypothetical protein [Alteromonas sp. W364]MDT0629281.1 hypothetical protein [Alteromonas sp. W364]